MSSADSLYPQVDVNFDEVRKTIEAGQYQPASKDRLYSMDRVSDIWERPPDKHIHIFIRLPSEVGRRPGDTDTHPGEFFSLLVSAQVV